MSTVIDGIIIAGVGGSAAGVVLYAVNLMHKKRKDTKEGEMILEWLHANTSDEDGKRFKSTKEIASWIHLTEDRVRYLCSVNPQIFLCIGANEDRWSLYRREPDRQLYFI